LPQHAGLPALSRLSDLDIHRRRELCPGEPVKALLQRGCGGGEPGPRPPAHGPQTAPLHQHDCVSAPGLEEVPDLHQEHRLRKLGPPSQDVPEEPAGLAAGHVPQPANAVVAPELADEPHGGRVRHPCQLAAPVLGHKVLKILNRPPRRGVRPGHLGPQPEADGMPVRRAVLRQGPGVLALAHCEFCQKRLCHRRGCGLHGQTILVDCKPMLNGLPPEFQHKQMRPLIHLGLVPPQLFQSGSNRRGHSALLQA